MITGCIMSVRNHPHAGRVYSAISRCNSETTRDFRRYGERGIGVYLPWVDKPQLFMEYLETLGPCPPGYSMDRIDNDRDYEPGNLQWSSAREQVLNRTKDGWVPGPSRIFSDDEIARMKELHAQGMSFRKIARMYGYSTTTVVTWIKR